jgi:phage gp45-like
VTITATDDKGPVHRVQGRVRGTPETIDNMQVVQLYGVASHAPVGSDALAVFGNGDRSNSVIVATANQKARPRNQKPGEVTIFTDEGDTISLQRNHTISTTTKTIATKADTATTIDSPQITLGPAGTERANGNVQFVNTDVTLAHDPTAALHAATKEYVDAVAGGGGVTGPPGPEGPPGPQGPPGDSWGSEAPLDGLAYGRQSATWHRVLAITGDILDGGNF